MVATLYPQLVITARGKTFKTNYFDPIGDNVSVDWTTIDVPGRSIPLYMYNKTQGQSFDLKIYLVSHMDNKKEIVDNAKWFKSLAYPDYNNGGLTIPPPIVHFYIEGLFDYDCIVNSVNITYKDAYHNKLPVYGEISLNISIASIIPFEYTDILQGAVPHSQPKIENNSNIPLLPHSEDEQIVLKAGTTLKNDVKKQIKDSHEKLSDYAKKMKHIAKNINDIRKKIDEARKLARKIQKQLNNVKQVTSALKRFAEHPSLRNLTGILSTAGDAIKQSGLSNEYLNEVIDSIVETGESAYDLQLSSTNIIYTASAISSDINSIKHIIGH